MRLRHLKVVSNNQGISRPPTSEPRVIVTTSTKGGVGKTASAKEFALALQRIGPTVLVEGNQNNANSDRQFRAAFLSSPQRVRRVGDPVTSPSQWYSDPDTGITVIPTLRNHRTDENVIRGIRDVVRTCQQSAAFAFVVIDAAPFAESALSDGLCQLASDLIVVIGPEATSHDEELERHLTRIKYASPPIVRDSDVIRLLWVNHRPETDKANLYDMAYGQLASQYHWLGDVPYNADFYHLTQSQDQTAFTTPKPIARAFETIAESLVITPAAITPPMQDSEPVPSWPPPTAPNVVAFPTYATALKNKPEPEPAAVPDTSPAPVVEAVRHVIAHAEVEAQRDVETAPPVSAQHLDANPATPGRQQQFLRLFGRPACSATITKELKTLVTIALAGEISLAKLSDVLEHRHKTVRNYVSTLRTHGLVVDAATGANASVRLAADVSVDVNELHGLTQTIGEGNATEATIAAAVNALGAIDGPPLEDMFLDEMDGYRVNLQSGIVYAVDQLVDQWEDLDPDERHHPDGICEVLLRLDQLSVVTNSLDRWAIRGAMARVAMFASPPMLGAVQRAVSDSQPPSHLSSLIDGLKAPQRSDA